MVLPSHPSISIHPTPTPPKRRTQTIMDPASQQMNRVGASAGSDPPPNKETLKRAAQVRIDVMTGSIQGLGFGLVLGAGGWPLLCRTVLRSRPQFLQSKYHVFATLCVGAFGSFIGSVTSARNSVNVALLGLESEYDRDQRRRDDAFERRKQALAQRTSPSASGNGGYGVAQEGGVVLDAGSAFPNPFAEPPPQQTPQQQGEPPRSF